VKGADSERGWLRPRFADSAPKNEQGESMSKEGVRPVVFDLQGRLEAGFKEVDQMLMELKKHEDPKIRILAMAERRKHLYLATRALEIAIRAEAVRDFQADVLDALADSGVLVRRRIMGIFEARAKEE
jgi:hypothetical protein